MPSDTNVVMTELPKLPKLLILLLENLTGSFLGKAGAGVVTGADAGPKFNDLNILFSYSSFNIF